MEVRLLAGAAELRAAADLVVAVWGTGQAAAPVHPDLLRAVGHSGGYVAGAFDGDAGGDGGHLVGMSMGFLGREGPGSTVLHSHVTGVLDGHAGRDVGAALKQHQRAWAAGQGLDAVTWTFDPLVRRNAWFNLGRLGAEVVAYLPDFYGSMTDGLNAGDESDRLLVRWSVDAAGTAAAAVDAGTARLAGATVLLDEGDDGGPAPTGRTGGATALCRVPADVVSLRRTDPGVARRWRRALRSALGGALDDGCTVAGVSRDGWYLLRRADR